jgi:hypothetical protein
VSKGPVALAVALAAAGCAHRAAPAAPVAPRPQPADGRAFLYGVVEVPAALGAPACVVVIEADRDRGAGGRHGCLPATADGLFWAQDLAPIRWVVDGVYAGGALHRIAGAAPFAVAAGALHDFGVFHLAPGGARGAALVAASRPTRDEVLRRLLAQDGIASRWKERIEARLREASAPPAPPG